MHVGFGYFLLVRQNRTWALRAGATTLAEGRLPRLAGGSATRTAAWHELKIGAVGDSIKGWVDGQLLADVTDTSFARGWAGVGSGFHLAQFANFSLSCPSC